MGEPSDINIHTVSEGGDGIKQLRTLIPVRGVDDLLNLILEVAVVVLQFLACVSLPLPEGRLGLPSTLASALVIDCWSVGQMWSQESVMGALQSHPHLD
jgi:hypothetical protein